ncbi:peptidyl-prolyl cis-trans isomerase A (cyclophilin A) [Candidatus Aquiluna sp. UB-MaderosW2red]|jgi:peptidyl-prolyl cis-trans isomerase A (cyclophilin A)|nr:peptidyl-prolyl cis-trans isomerase A (cyclophilin A) [Candidatus Aquiluna sp. UB-MaderosW2red]
MPPLSFEQTAPKEYGTLNKSPVFMIASGGVFARQAHATLEMLWHNIGMTSPTAIATLHTNHGAIKLNLFGLHAPKTVENFVGLATGTIEWKDPRTGATHNGKSLYEGVIFHRIIAGFMLQSGDPAGTGMGGPGYQFGDEIHPELNFNDPYMLAMANAGPSTNGSQFFITVAPTSWLQGKHTVFGEVADDVSRKVVDKIGAVATDGRDKPLEEVVIESISIETL